MAGEEKGPDLKQQTQHAIVERIPRWLVSVAFASLVIVIIASFATGKCVSLSPFGVVECGGGDGDLPPGAVVAFAGLRLDPNARYPKCPGGWDELTSARGKFIMGADPALDYGRGNQTHYTGEGGAHEITLTINELPPHNHGISASRGEVHDGLGGSAAGIGIDTEFRSDAPETSWGRLERVIGNRGYGQPYNNLPPYIALTWCKKQERGNP